MKPTPIKFGTDGWRGLIADDFTVHNVARVAQAVAVWMASRFANPTLVLGHDCRFGGPLFSGVVARVCAARGVRVLQAQGFVSTPMLSLACQKLGADFGVILTASHNPPTWNGFKLKASYGGPATPAMVTEVEALIPDEADALEAMPTLEQLRADGLIQDADLERLYIERCEQDFDFDTIARLTSKVAYDAMYGAGQRVGKMLLPRATFIHADDNPGFKGTPPEPILKNLKELQHMLANYDEMELGIATDGDADRIGLMDGEGNFVDSHHIILLLIQYLHVYKGLTGKVVVSFSCSQRIKALCAHYGLELEVTKIGFKYICEIMTTDDVLVGGEESGGIAVKGYIPERDGLYIGLMLVEFMAKTGKTLQDLIAEVYAITGSFACERDDLHVTEAVKASVIERSKARAFDSFGGTAVREVADLDGYKFYLENEGEWLMVRPSGTEPVLRVYAEAATSERARFLLDSARSAFFEGATVAAH